MAAAGERVDNQRTVAAERGDNQRTVAAAGERSDNQRTVAAAAERPGAVEGPIASPREAMLAGRATQTPVERNKGRAKTRAGGAAAGPAEGGTHAARSDSDPRAQLPEPWQHMAEHPGHGYVRTAGGYL